MKPRLVAAPHTAEDWKILCDMRACHERWRDSNLLAMSEDSDRRDADLMFIAQRDRFVGAIWSRGDPFDSEFDVLVRLGLVRHITGLA